MLEKFIKNSVIKSLDEHDKSMKNEEDYLNKLEESGLFTIEGNKITFDSDALELTQNQEYKKDFMNSFEEYLLFDYIEKLKYEQYGLNDFYWALDKQNKKQPLIRISAPVEDKEPHVHSISCSHSKSIDQDIKDNQDFGKCEPDSIPDEKKPNKKQPAIEEIKEESFVNLSVAVEEEKPQQNEKETFAPSSVGKDNHVHSDSCSHHASFMCGFIGKDGKLGKGGKKKRKPSADVGGRKPNEEISSQQLVEGSILEKKSAKF